MSRERLQLDVRLGFLVLWVAILVWLPVEDTTPLYPRILATATSVLLALRGLLRFDRAGLLVTAGLGLVAGLLVNPFTAGLMVFKSGLHAHSAPDFSVATLAAVLADTPVFGLGGLLIGAGLYYYLQK
ncbi:MAG TPA: hypothetical protein VMN57_08640 [Anaerolineales bacterium]|nr:hypothetical protein [Anaerolineales bacterium]